MKSVRKILERNGYKVLAAENGMNVLKIVISRGKEINMLLTDVVMPDMNRIELYTKLIRNYPALKVIYMCPATRIM